MLRSLTVETAGTVCCRRHGRGVRIRPDNSHFGHLKKLLYNIQFNKMTAAPLMLMLTFDLRRHLEQLHVILE